MKSVANLSRHTIEPAGNFGGIVRPDYFWPLKTDVEPIIGNLPLTFVNTTLEQTEVWNGSVRLIYGLDTPTFKADNDYLGLCVSSNSNNEYFPWNDCSGVKTLTPVFLAGYRLFELFGEADGSVVIENGTTGVITGSPVTVNVGDQVKANVTTVGDLKVTFSGTCYAFNCDFAWPNIYSQELTTPVPAETSATFGNLVIASPSFPSSEYTNDFCYGVEYTPWSTLETTSVKYVMVQGGSTVSGSLYTRYNPVTGNFELAKRTVGVTTVMCTVAGTHDRTHTNKIMVKQESTGVTLFVDGVASTKNTTTLGKADISYYTLVLGRLSVSLHDINISAMYKNLAAFNNPISDSECISSTTHGIML